MRALLRVLLAAMLVTGALTVHAVPASAQGPMRIYNALSRNYCLTFWGIYNEVRMTVCNGSNEQKWIFAEGSIANIIFNSRSNWTLDHTHAENNTVPTSTVVAWPVFHGLANQQWFNAA